MSSPRVRALVDRSGRLRAVFVLVAAVAATVGYGLFLHGGSPGSAFRGQPIGDWLFWKLAAMWAWGLLLSAACVSAGFLALTRVFHGRDLPTLETLVQSAALGLVVFVLGMYAGGFARQFNAVFAVALPAAMLATGARPLAAFARERHAAWIAAPTPPGDLLSRVVTLAAMAFGFYGLVFVYLGAMTPEAINFDASWTHLVIAADYARAGRIVPFDADYDRCVPHLASLVHTWAMIVPSWGVLTEPPVRWMLALHLELFFFLWTLAGVAAMTAWLLDVPRARASWAAFFLFPAIFVYDKNLGGAADHWLALFAAPLFLAAMRAAPRFSVRSSALAGVYAGGALLCKYQAVYLLAGVGAVFAGAWILAALGRAGPDVDARPSRRELLLGPLALVGALLVVSAPHFLKNWAFYRNPVYPFAQDLIASRPTTRNAAYLFEWFFKDYRYRPHGGAWATVREGLGAVYAWAFATHYSFTHDVPDGGALFTLGLPVALALRRSTRIWLGYGAGLGCLLAWAMVFRVDRHLQTFMPLLAATTAAVLARAWELGLPARVGVALLVGLQVVWAGDAPFYGSERRIEAAIDLLKSTYEGRARKRFAGFRAPYRALGAALPKAARVLLHEQKPGLGIDRDLVLDTPGRQAILDYGDVHGPRALHDLYRSLGVTHLVWKPGQKPASTKQEDVLFADYAHRFARPARGFDDLALAALAAAPPPPDAPYRVLALGLTGYDDGLYAVERMGTYETIPIALGAHEAYAPPEVALPAEPAARAPLVERADAVCLAETFQLDAVLLAGIDARFEVAETYPEAFTIYVRKKKGAILPPSSRKE